MIFRLFLLSCLLVAALPVRAQKQYVREQQTWLGVFNQTRFSQRWGTWTDLHLRLHDRYVQDLFQGVARVGLTYYLTDDVRLTGAMPMCITSRMGRARWASPSTGRGSRCSGLRASRRPA
ncbi:DUF2490 domain-containing protein [Hymenobacter volaticus]|uniref:DUF2490 domain-containing protein n=1 Tax=Hymenobacter volaticus TaxID=2932254 RepID=A0ABY4GAI3_9BACT|nr:DUF2490 domain-containing protein [Hymenobacter volaticus]UOQ67917.1 DUF2490 domain-containing protein [Hymenobacter volaticus]